MTIFKCFIKVILALILSVVMLWMAAFALLQTRTGQIWVFSSFLHYLEEQTHTEIYVGKFIFSFPLHLKFKDVVISQNGQPVLVIHKAETECAFQRLLEGRLIFPFLRISEVELLKLPTSPESPQEKKMDNLTSWDKSIFPFYAKIEKIDIQKIHFADEVINRFSLPEAMSQAMKDSTLSLDGVIANNPFTNFLFLNLSASFHKQDSDPPPLSITLNAQHHQLSISLLLDDFHFALGDSSIPFKLQTKLALFASAPLISWQKHLYHLPHPEDSPIKGHLRLTIDSEGNIPFQSTIQSQFSYKPTHEIDISDLIIDTPVLTIGGQAAITPERTIHHATFKGGLNRLHDLKEWIGQEIHGNIAFEGNTTGSFLSPAIDFKFASPSLRIAQHDLSNFLSALQIVPSKDGVEGLLNFEFKHQDAPCNGTTAFRWNSQHGFAFSNIHLDACGLQVQGDLSCASFGDIWTGKVEAHTDNLNNLPPFLSLSFTGKAHIQTELSAQTNTQGMRQQALRLELTGQDIRGNDFEANHLRLIANSDALHYNSPFFIAAQIEMEQIDCQNIQADSLFAKGSCSADPALLTLSNLGIEWTGKHFSWNESTAETGEGNLNLLQPMILDQGVLHASLKKVKWNDIHFEELAGKTTLDAAQLNQAYTIEGAGRWKEPFHFSVEGSWSHLQKTWKIQTDRLTGMLGIYPLELLKTTRLQISSENINVEGLHLRLAGSEIQGDYQQQGQSVTGQFHSNAIPTELFHLAALDLPLTGHVAISGRIEGTVDLPQAAIQIGMHRLQITEDIFVQKPLIEGTIDLQLNQQLLQIDSQVNGIGRTPVSLSGHFPVHFSIRPLQFTLEKEKPFSLSMSAEGELDPYLHLFYNDATHLAGQTKIALNLTGTLHDPQIHGSINIANGSFESLNSGAIYHHIQVHLKGDGSKIILSQFSAEDTKQGSITATGSISLNPAEAFPYEFQIHPRQIFIIDSDYASISASGPLTLAGNYKTSKLQGTLTVDHATIHLDETAPRRLKTIEVKYINIPEGSTPPAHFEIQESPSVIALDVALEIPNTLTIDGSKIKSEWKGSVAIRGTPDQPQLFGDLRIAKGSYDFNGKAFSLTQGTIHFAGPIEKKTTLYVVASKEIDPINAEIIVKGSVDKPAISFRSNPPLSQREVLSYILFNRGISDITTDQGDQLSQSFIALNTGDQAPEGNDFLSRVRNKIGIDRLDFAKGGNPESNDIAMQVGKKVTENIFVSINQTMNAVAPLLAVEIRLHKNIKAQADAGRIGDDTQFRTSIKWKKDY